jgi:hypothetical protein
LGGFQVAIAIVVVPHLQKLLQSYVQIDPNPMREDSFLKIEDSLEVSFQVIANSQLQAILLTLYNHARTVNFNRDAIAFVFGDFMQTVTATHQMQSVQIFLLVFVQLLEYMIAASFTIDYSVSLFPTGHY